MARLREALERRGVDPKGDWLLTPGEDYERRLRELNLGADAFVFVISGDSIRSKACRDELALAVQHKKPILPVSHREHGDDDRLDSALRAPQWTMLRDGDDLESGADDLVRAVRTDFDLMETHAQLLLAGERWSGSGRNASYLLSKAMVGKAEDWLARVSAQPEKLPQPTPLQTDLIIASRHAQTRTARRLLTVAAGIIAAMAVLTIVAVSQRNLARQRQVEAEEQTRIATANFASQAGTVSLTLPDRAYDTALLLAVEATKIADTRATRGALLSALLKHSHLVTLFHGHSRTVEHIAFSGDGRSIASTDERNIVVGELATGATRRGERLGDLKLESIALSHDGSLVAAGDSRGQVRIWDTRTMKLSHGPLGTERWTTIGPVAITRDETKLVAVEGTAVTVWDLQTRRPLSRTLLAGDSAALAVSDDGSMIALGGGWGAIVLQTSTLRPIGPRLEPRDQIREERMPSNHVVRLHFTTDDARLVTVTGQANFIEWDPRTGRRITAPPEEARESVMQTFALSDDGAKVASADGSAILMDFPGEKYDPHHPVDLFQQRSAIGALLFSPDGRLLAAGGAGFVALWDVSVVHRIGDDEDSFSRLSRAVRAPDAGRKHRIGEEATFGTVTGVIRDVQRSMDGKKIGIAVETAEAMSRDQTVVVLDATTGAPDAAPFTLSYGHDFVFTPDGRSIIHGTHEQGQYLVRDLASATVRARTLPGPNTIVDRVALSPDGSLLATFGPETRSQRDLVAAHEFYRVLAGGERLRVWELATGKPVGLPMEHASVRDLEFSPDGKSLASAGSGIRLWDVSSGTLIGMGFGGPAEKIAFAPDGKSLTAFASDGSATLWNLDLASWQRQACAVANRNMTQTEWRDSFGTLPYRQTCPGR